MDIFGQTFQKTPQTLTARPGVYLYYDREGTVLYVGKAKNLRNRVRQYFSRDDAVGAKTPLLVSQITSIKTIPTDSEFDALLLEANLIRTYLPKYNAAARDDKSPLYIAITLNEKLPRILFARKQALDRSHDKTVFGPFQSGRIARKLMQSVRHIIPYCTQKRRDGKPCFYTHLGLCRPCPSTIHTPELARVYRKNLKRIALLLSGKAARVRSQLEQSMTLCADRMDYEQAGEYKKQLDALRSLLTHTFEPDVYADKATQRITDLSRILHLSSLKRIECIDISTLQGKWSTGSLVVFTDGIPDTDHYRRFRIKATPPRPNDVGMMAEVIKRRFAHWEWPKPDLLIVDGGKPQVATAMHLAKDIPVIGLAKRFEEIVIPKDEGFTVLRLQAASGALQLVEHIRDEAHRFAKRYHTMLRSKYV
ncbi:GIY-YIG nuclease family protein [Candidatus Gottesmanbacteria bacterium]|nr:GIY-YIG nuclease family protein [Candidatus Gottesmanbacteria bacterium]